MDWINGTGTLILKKIIRTLPFRTKIKKTPVEDQECEILTFNIWKKRR
jgi:hypothetical protein